MTKQSLEQRLKEVDYSFLNSEKYIPSDFAFRVTNFIKAVMADSPEKNKTPPFHLKMLDTILERKSNYVVNLMFRGSGKTTLFSEFFIFYLAAFRRIPGIGNQRDMIINSAIYVGDTVDNGVKSLRKNLEFRYNNSQLLQEILPGARFRDNYIEFPDVSGKDSRGPFGLKMFGAATGLRGTKIFNGRPRLAIIDDVISDEASRSKATLGLIKDTIYKGVNYALDPTQRLVIMNGTPFSKDDPIIEAVESGSWDVNVFPVCEKFPCAPEEFSGAWEDRFSYRFIKEQYELACGSGHPDAFYQEMMLQISSEDTRLIRDVDVNWYSRQDLMKNIQNMNIYITTDFAVSSRNSADFSVISVWAYSNNRDWFYLDGICAKQTMDKNVDCLFDLVSRYQPVLSVGIESSGQQGGFISLIEREMHTRNVYFSIASSGSGKGIRPVTDKVSRLNCTVPWFRQGKMYFPEELKESSAMTEFLSEISMASNSGIKGHDDFLDTVSQLYYLNAQPPGCAVPMTKGDSDIWHRYEEPEDSTSGYDSYIV